MKRRREPPPESPAVVRRQPGERRPAPEAPPPRERPPGERDQGPPRGGDLGPPRDRGFGPPRDRGFGPPRDREFGPPRDRGFGPPRDRDAGPPRDRGFGPPRDRDAGPPQDRGFGPPPDRQFGPPRDRGFGPPRDREFGPPRDRGFGPPRDRDAGPPRDRGFGPPRGRGPTGPGAPRPVVREFEPNERRRTRADAPRQGTTAEPGPLHEPAEPAHDHEHAPGEHAHEHDEHGEHAEHEHEHGEHEHGEHDEHDEHEHDEHAHEHEHDEHEHDEHTHTHGEHTHTHAHAHPHAATPAALVDGPGPRLPRGAGRGQLLFLDAQSGVAGDMCVAALVDLGVPFGVVEAAIAALGLPGVRVSLVERPQGSLGALGFDVHEDAPQPARDHASIDALLLAAPLDPPTRALARAIFQRLAEAEAAVHRVPVERVHFHEVGAVDSIADIVGAAACLAWLEAEAVEVAPLPLGRGFVNTAHGRLPLPAPATLLCLDGLATRDAGIEGELVTPTGAAIVGTVARGSTHWPALVPRAVGMGAGTRRLPDRPNLLRAVLGEPTATTVDADTAVSLIEATLDDATGELLGHALAAALAAGALDAWAVPATGKKGRPAVILGVLARRGNEAAVAAVLLRETSTLGVRILDARRIERPRHEVTVSTPWGDVPVKVGGGPWGAAQAKPEFDRCRELAAAAGVPVRVVLAAAMASAVAAGLLG